MKEILGSLIVERIFTMDAEDFEGLVSKTLFKASQPPEEGEFMTRYRRALASPPKTGIDTIRLLDGTQIIAYSTPDKMVSFLKSLPTLLKEVGDTIEDVAFYKYRIEDLILDKPLLSATLAAHAGSQVKALEAIVNQDLVDVGYDFFNSDLAQRNWFHLTVHPTPTRTHKTSVRLVVTRIKLDDMIDIMKRVPAIMQMVENELLKP